MRKIKMANVINPTEPNNLPPIVALIKYLIIIGGEKGGVGKSFLARYLLCFFITILAEEEIACYDADPSVDDVYQIFSDKDWMKKAVFSPDKFRVKEGSKVFEETKPIVVINSPSNIKKDFNNFCEDNGIFEEDLQEEMYEKCYFFFVSDGSYQSVKLFVEHLERYKDKAFIKTILFLNSGQNGNSNDFSYLGIKDDFEVLSNLAQKIKQYKVPVLIINELPPLVRFKVDGLLSERNLKFSELMTRGQTELVTLERSHFKRHLAKFEALFKQLFEFEEQEKNGKKAVKIKKIKYDELVKKQEYKRNQDKLFVA